MTTIDIILSDAVEWAREYRGEKFHALFCDSPYHLSSITKRFGKDGAKPPKGGAFSRATRGFMGKTWDGGDVAFRSSTWKAFRRVMHDGAFGITYGGSRGWHRLAVAIEDAGFIIHPTIFGWAYGSGFPKATRVNADGFEGYRYGLQALKPAVEPIIVFQKPYQGRARDQIVETGAGALNIDGTRIGNEEIPSNQWVDAAHPFGNGAGNEYRTVKNRGRWPANFVLMDNEAARALDEQSGVLRSGDNAIRSQEGYFGAGDARSGKLGKSGDVQTTYGDQGGASRFFFSVSEQIDSADPIYYCAKVSQQERNAGLDGFPKTEIGHNRFDTCANCGGYMFQNKERDSACTCENPERVYNSVLNPHPTLKPISLNRYLTTLLLPPEKYAPRRIFIPFAGVGSEMIGAMQAGWEDIQGVEITPDYIPVAQARIEYWKKKGWQSSMF